VRIAFALPLACCLAACGGNDVPPPGQEELRASRPVVEEGSIVLRADGITVGAESFYFGAGQTELEGKLTGALGGAGTVNLMEGCSDGVIEAHNRAMLDVHYRDGIFVGWSTGHPRGDALPGGGTLDYAGDLAVGIARDTLEEVRGLVFTGETRLGEEFAASDAMGGFVEDGAVARLYAGMQCIAR
jgi:hypothetical protein